VSDRGSVKQRPNPLDSAVRTAVLNILYSYKSFKYLYSKFSLQYIKIDIILTSIIEIIMNFTYKFKGIISISSISCFYYSAVFLVLCFLIHLVVLELKKG
jgi:hypothetical protein